MPTAPRLTWPNWAKAAGFIGALVLLALLGWRFLAGDGVDRSRVYAIDYGNDVPFHFQGEDGAPTGLAVDLVREAARAKNIRLEWIPEPATNQPPRPLRVLLTVRTNLSKDLHLTEPYLQSRSSFIVASNTPIRSVNDLEGKRISYPNYAIHRVNVARVLNSFIAVPVVSSRDAMEKFSAGQADAAFMSDYAVVPTCLNVPLPFPVRILPSQAPVSRMAIASRHEYARVADALRDGIRDMAVDGRMERIVDRWGFFPNLTSDRRDELIREKRKVMWFQIATGFLLFMVGLSGWLIARLRVERSLARTAERIRSATLDALPADIALLDRDGVIIAVNQSWSRPSQEHALRSHDYRVGQNYLELCGKARGAAAADAQAAADGIRRVLRGEAGEFMLEYPGHSPEGQHWFRLMVTPMAETGRHGVVVMHIDITERKLTELALKSSEQKSRSIVESTPVPMAVNDEQQRITFLNRAFVKTFGYTLTDIPTVGDWWRKAFPDAAHRDKVEAVWRAELSRTMDSGGEFQPMEVRIRAKDGADRVVLAAASLFQGTTQEEHLVVLIDITERKRQESERQKLESQLRHAQKMEAVGVLAGGIAHDFNNILGAIIGNAFLAGSELSPAHPTHEFLREIQKASARATALVRQILAFSRKEPREQQVLELRGVVEEATRLLRSTLPAGVELNSRFSEAPMVVADPTEIHQAVINLGTNAWHAMGGRPGRIELSVEGVAMDAESARANPDLHAGSYVRLTVTDNGQGMTAETMEHIFEPFFTTKEVGKGTGLGLAVVHGIMKSHQGAILVRSEPGRGTTFELYFPAALDQRPPQAEAAPPRTEARGQDQRILLVDDEEPLVRAAAKLLERKGFRVTGFNRPEAGLEAFEAAPEEFDLVITDYNMPGCSGLELARKIRQRHRKVPIILTSGFITDQLRREAEAAGVTQLAGKPLSPDEMMGIIQRLVGSNGRAANGVKAQGG